MTGRVGTVIQARLGSTRLTGKVLADIAGRPMLEHVVRRAQRARLAALVVVATTTKPGDDPVVDLAERLGVPVVRGSEDDVLDRYRLALEQHALDVVVRVTSDCPLLDPEVLDLAVGRLLAEPSLDYVSNTVERTYPRGLDVEAVRAGALGAAAREATAPYEREHVTPFIWQRPERFRLAQIRHDRDLSGWRLTVDTEADLQLARAVYARVGDTPSFGLEAIAAVLDREPHLLDMNATIAQKVVPDR